VRDALNDDLRFLRAQGIGAVLSLTETPLDSGALARFDLRALHLPVPDLTPPSSLQLRMALDFIDLQRSQGRRVVVHCLMGQGRTGTVLAAHRIRSGASAEEAMAELRGICPGAISAAAQERALRDFAAKRDWVL
jgi:atypical dual specificity phosphatase